MQGLGPLILPRRRLEERQKQAPARERPARLSNVGRRRHSVDAVDGSSGMAPAHRQHDDLGADVDAVIEVHHILVEQPNAARRYEAADRLGRVGVVSTGVWYAE